MIEKIISDCDDKKKLICNSNRQRLLNKSEVLYLQDLFINHKSDFSINCTLEQLSYLNYICETTCNNTSCDQLAQLVGQNYCLCSRKKECGNYN